MPDQSGSIQLESMHDKMTSETSKINLNYSAEYRLPRQLERAPGRALHVPGFGIGVTIKIYYYWMPILG